MLGQKTGGRQAGTPNKRTKELRDKITEVIGNELENIEQTLAGLEPKAKLELIIKLLSFALPKAEAEVNNEPTTLRIVRTIIDRNGNEIADNASGGANIYE